MEQGLSYYKAEQYADAIAAFDSLIQLTPDYAGADFNTGNALVGMGRYEEAVAAYDQAIRLVQKPETSSDSLRSCFVPLQILSW